MLSKKKLMTGYEVLVYSMTDRLWRWEIRWGGTLVRCGTSLSKAAAERDATQEMNA